MKDCGCASIAAERFEQFPFPILSQQLKDRSYYHYE